MQHTTAAPFGSWASPITAEIIAAGSVRLGDGDFFGEGLIWVEGRPLEGGRQVIVYRAPDGATTDLIPSPFNARTRVHEYGGGAVVIGLDEIIFSNFSDQRLYRVRPGRAPEALTAEGPFRYADGVLDAARSRIVCVREDHSRAPNGRAEDVVNALVAVPLESGGAQQILVQGNDFYSSPRLSPDGRTLAWLTWNHPNMPWDGCELWVAEIGPDGLLHGSTMVAGGERESIFQPTWSPDGILTFASDRTGWWNLYRSESGETRCLISMEAEFGAPQWGLGMQRFGYLTPSTLICIYSRHGLDHLATLDVTSGTLTTLDVPYTALGGLRVSAGCALVVGGAPTRPTTLIRICPAIGELECITQASRLDVDEGFLAPPAAVEFPTDGGLSAHGWYYQPRNRNFAGPEGALPPLLVISHGGPTGMSSNALSLAVQYWTSRGFAVLDVNYGGSSSYGRAYRERLVDSWGVVDVVDCVRGAQYLARQGLVDPLKMAIRGGSAGGYTTLCALTFHTVFAAGASHYGISDLETMTADTHKFESRYLDRLIGPYPERRDLYLERSPIYHIEGLSCPVIFFQGLEDKVVPPAQAETMVAALKAKGLPVAYLAFEGEQHGFRRAANIKRALEAELYFYSRIFGFPLAEPIEPVSIWNLEP